MEDQVLRFENYELDVARRELRHDGEPVSLQPRVFDLLLYLVQHHDRAVAKDELQDAVWPGMVVTETALTRAVMKARKAVGDDASTQSLIRTVHGHGYHFVAAIAMETIAPGNSGGPAPRPKQASGQHWLIGTLAGLMVIAALLGLWKVFTPPGAPAEIRVAFLPLLDTTENPEFSWMRLGLMSLASTTLASGGEIPVVDDGNVVGLASSTHWDGRLEGPAGETLLQRLRQVYGATHVVAMQLREDGAGLRMDYSLVNAQGDVSQGTMVGRDGIELTQGVVQSVHGRLVGKSRLGGKPGLVSKDPFNIEAFARGMDYSLEGRCADAVPYFRLIAEQEPSLFTPRLELAGCLRILGKPEEAEALLTQLINEQTSLQNPEALAQALMVLGILQNRTGRLDEAENRYRQALQFADEAANPDLAARITHNLAILAKNRGNWAASLEYLDRAAAEYQRAGREIMPGQLWSGYANLNMEQGRLEEADEFLEKALSAFRAAGDRRNEAMMLNNFGYLRRLQGRLLEAEDYHLRSLAIREDLRDQVGVGRNHSMLAALYSARGDYEQALESATMAVSIAREASDRLFEGTSLIQQAGVEQAMGQTELARQHYLEARAILESFQDPMRVLQLDIRLARMELSAGLPQAAEAVAQATLDAARAGDFIQPEIDSLVLLGDANRARSRFESAQSYFQLALSRVRETGFAARESIILIRLAEGYMDMDELENVAPLIGGLARLEPTVGSLKTQARYAWLQGDHELAQRYMAEARKQAGADWSSENEATYHSYLGKIE